MDQIRRILTMKEESDVKLYLINEVVNGGKSGKGLSEIEITNNGVQEEIF